MIGLDYAALFQVARVLDIKITPGLMRKIQVLEHHDIKKNREQIEKKRGKEE